MTYTPPALSDLSIDGFERLDEGTMPHFAEFYSPTSDVKIVAFRLKSKSLDNAYWMRATDPQSEEVLAEGRISRSLEPGLDDVREFVREDMVFGARVQLGARTEAELKAGL